MITVSVQPQFSNPKITVDQFIDFAVVNVAMGERDAAKVSFFCRNKDEADDLASVLLRVYPAPPPAPVVPDFNDPTPEIPF
jgi:hypothetical protein